MNRPKHVARIERSEMRENPNDVSPGWRVAPSGLRLLIERLYKTPKDFVARAKAEIKP